MSRMPGLFREKGVTRAAIRSPSGKLIMASMRCPVSSECDGFSILVEMAQSKPSGFGFLVM